MNYLSDRYFACTVFIGEAWDFENAPQVIEKAVKQFIDQSKKQVHFFVPSTGKTSLLLLDFLKENDMSHTDIEVDFEEFMFNIKGKAKVRPSEFAAIATIALSTHLLLFHDKDAQCKKMADFARKHKVKVIGKGKTVPKKRARRQRK